MAEPRLYLVTPPILTLEPFGELLARLLDAVEVACVRLSLATASEDELTRAADALRAVCHARDVPLVVAEHYRLAARLGLDGVHLADGPRRVRAAREALGANGIVGAHARASRHDGMTAAEIGADYVAFGPVEAGVLGDGVTAPFELFEWWSEMIETPVVAEGGLTLPLAATLAPVADFLALGAEIWDHPDGPESALRAYAALTS
ncbi:thiamine phosphate synthase [Amaricoccus sp.]|uniref:thiamine phosphate synthase n=1 Tax=Amaricoccus sp. TaxID=1872485 RepID=UPI001B549BF8|nr:thiamine phosphate synthase [Amaricoccus sp.]MBP7002946.1 thiamine phosphate synthase [Amaricoccus sp.]